MRIGVYCQGLSAETGGGFTFEHNVLRGLASHSSRHEFVIFHVGAVTSDRIAAPTGSQFVQIEPTKLVARAGRYFRPRFFAPAARFWRRATRSEPPGFVTSPLNRALLKHAIDLVWFPTPTNEPVDIPFIATVWDLQHRRQPHFPEVSVSGFLWEDRERSYAQLRRATYVMVGNETAKDEVMRFYGIAPERVRCIEFPTPEFALRTTTSIALPSHWNLERSKFLFYPAQFWPHKNHVVLLKVLKQLDSLGHGDLTLALTGADKGNLAHVQSMATRLGVDGRVHYLGFVSEEEMVALYQNAFALTFASFFGPNNFPPLEAMALGCPVLCADADGMREQLGDAAQFFAPTDAATLARLICDLRAAPELRDRLVSKGRARASSLTMVEYFRRMVALFDEFQPIRETWGPSGTYRHL